jgi:hypothetical protein
MRGFEQPADVFACAKDRGAAILALVTAHPLEHAEAVMQAVGQNMDPRLVEGDKLTVKPDLVRSDPTRTFFCLCHL